MEHRISQFWIDWASGVIILRSHGGQPVWVRADAPPPRLCAVPGCGRKHLANDLCSTCLSWSRDHDGAWPLSPPGRRRAA